MRNAARLRKIVSVFAKHGFENLAERIELGSFILSKFRREPSTNHTVAERLRMCFEELGPTFIKFGQVLASRPDLIPPDIASEFAKLQDQVAPVSFSELKPYLDEQFDGDLRQTFLSFEEAPLAAASMAQVHRAVLRDGGHVVVKVLRPQIHKLIEQDMQVMALIADLLERYIPEAQTFHISMIVEEFFQVMALETNLAIEANNIRRFKSNFDDYPNIKIPDVYFQLSGEKVLVLEEIVGLRLSALTPGAVDYDPDQIMRTGLKAYFKMVFTDGFFHGDLHPGNIFLLENNRLALIDFGVVGRLNERTKSAIANMLVCLATEDYDRFAQEYVDLAPYSEHVDVDELARQLRNLISPYYGMTLAHVNSGQLLLQSAAVASQHELALPAELMLFFKSVVALDSLARLLHREFDFLTEAIEFSSELVQNRYDPIRISRDFLHWGRDLQSLVIGLPRQIRHYFKKINSPGHVAKFELKQFSELVRAVERSALLLFWALIVLAMIVSGALMVDSVDSSQVAGIPLWSFGFFVLSGIATLWAIFSFRR